MAINVAPNAVPSSGEIKFSVLREKLKDTTTGSVRLGELYRNGSFVPSGTMNTSIPTSGTISASNFRGSATTIVATITGVEENINANTNIFGTNYTTGLKKTIDIQGYVISQNSNPAMVIPSGAGVNIRIQLTSGGIFGHRATSTGFGGAGNFRFGCVQTLGGASGSCGESCPSADEVCDWNYGGGAYCLSGADIIQQCSEYYGCVQTGTTCSTCARPSTCYTDNVGGNGSSGNLALRTLSNIVITGTGGLIAGGGGSGGGGGGGGEEGGGGLNGWVGSCEFLGWQACWYCDRGVGGGNNAGGAGGSGGQGRGYSWNGSTLTLIGPNDGVTGTDPGDGGGKGGDGGSGGDWGSSGGDGQRGNDGNTGPGGSCAGGGPGLAGSNGGTKGSGGISIEGSNRIVSIQSSAVLRGSTVTN